MLRSISRRNCSQMFLKIDVLKNFLKVCNYIKMRLQRKCFSVNIAKFLRRGFFDRAPLVAAFICLYILNLDLKCFQQTLISSVSDNPGNPGRILTNQIFWQNYINRVEEKKLCGHEFSLMSCSPCNKGEVVFFENDCIL